MSRYGVDKALRRLMQREEARAEWRTDPAAVLTGCDLDDTERRALLDWDVGTIYALGAHPFLLWNAYSMLVEDREEVRAGYLEAVTPHGYPDITT